MSEQQSPLTEQLTAACLTEICKLDKDIEVSPEHIASLAIKEIDPKNKAPVLMQWGCNLQCRVIARRLLARNFDPTKNEEAKSAQNPLFPLLQDRYPTKRGGGSTYVLLDHITEAEAQYNIDRMRKHAASELAHADQLEAYITDRFAKKEKAK